ncbi:UNVERIFIED_CONTAM: hypothetical protein Sangu_0914400 [Sesamum angustifolium]|uniref:Uncharacterized protein n=1 Tax=Sesamum angustifolium TaxID=2727405 RepID=A0AAW2PF07_9LAMI
MASVGTGGGGSSSDEVPTSRAHHQEYNQWENYSSGGGVSEIEEEPSSGEFDENNSNGVTTILWKASERKLKAACTPSAAGKTSCTWRWGGRARKQAWMPWYGRSITQLIHLQPLSFSFMSFQRPMGKLPISQVNGEQRENYLAQERGKTREFLQKFVDMCSASSQKQVKVETILIESDMEAKAIVDLIPILNIRKLVVGTTKSNLRRMRSRRGNASGVADHILQNAPQFCDVKIICEGKEISELPSPSTPLLPLSHPVPLIGFPKTNHLMMPQLVVASNYKNASAGIAQLGERQTEDLKVACSIHAHRILHLLPLLFVFTLLMAIHSHTTNTT